MLKVIKHYEVVNPGGVPGPHPCYGKFVCTTEDAREANKLAGFMEDFWPGVGDKTVATSMSPTIENVVFWVNAIDLAKVREVIDTIVDDILQSAFENQGFKVQKEEA